MIRRRRVDSRDILVLIGLLGLGLLVWGVALVHVPAAYIVGGGSLVGLVVWRAR